jgi:hypothetical protein
MTTITTDQQLTLPANGDANDEVTAMTSYNGGVENRLVKRYLSAADRAARNPTPNAGELSYRADGLIFEAFVSGTWQTLQNTNGTVTRVKCQRLTTQAAANNTFTLISWTSADEYDTDGIHDIVTNPDRVVLNKLGLWSFSYSINGAAGAAGTHAAYLQKNNGGPRLGWNEGVGLNTATGTAPVICTTIGDFVNMVVFQSSGGSQNYAGSADSFMSGYYVGP